MRIIRGSELPFLFVVVRCRCSFYFSTGQGLSPELVASQYAHLQGVFAARGCDWVILTPHYVRPGPVEGLMGEGFDKVRVLLFVFSLCLSRACLGKMLVFKSIIGSIRRQQQEFSSLLTRPPLSRPLSTSID
jgi:hypothetical protein